MSIPGLVLRDILLFSNRKKEMLRVGSFPGPYLILGRLKSLTNSKKNSNKTTSAESKIIEKDAPNKMLFFSGHKGADELTVFESKLKSELLGQEDLELIKKISPARKGSFVLHFHDQKSVTVFKNKYSGQEFLGGKIRLV